MSNSEEGLAFNLIEEPGQAIKSLDGKWEIYHDIHHIKGSSKPYHVLKIYMVFSNTDISGNERKQIGDAPSVQQLYQELKKRSIKPDQIWQSILYVPSDKRKSR